MYVTTCGSGSSVYLGYTMDSNYNFNMYKFSTAIKWCNKYEDHEIATYKKSKFIFNNQKMIKLTIFMILSPSLTS